MQTYTFSRENTECLFSYLFIASVSTRSRIQSQMQLTPKHDTANLFLKLPLEKLS